MADAENAWAELSTQQSKSPFVSIAEIIPEEEIAALFAFEGLSRFRSTDEHGHQKVLGAKFPQGFANYVESIAENKSLGFGNKSNFLRAAVHLLVAICAKHEDMEIGPVILQFLATESAEREQRYREEALDKISLHEHMLRDRYTPNRERVMAETALKEYAVSHNEAVRDAAEQALRHV